jgi:hypothetical protein
MLAFSFLFVMIRHRVRAEENINLSCPNALIGHPHFAEMASAKNMRK